MVEINGNTYTLYLPISDLLYYPLTPTPFLPSHCSIQNLHKVDCKVQSPEFIPESRVQGPFPLLTYAKVDLYFILRGQSAACESCSSWERLGGIRKAGVTVGCALNSLTLAHAQDLFFWCSNLFNGPWTQFMRSRRNSCWPLNYYRFQCHALGNSSSQDDGMN